MSINYDQSFLSCNLCTFTCTNQRKMTIHMNRQHDHKVKPQMCRICRIFSSKSKPELRAHVLACRQTEVKCPYCSYVSRHRPRMRDHINFVHDKVRDHLCNFCTYRASKRYQLLRHIAGKHAKMRKYSCGNCNFTCLEKAALKRHHHSVHEGIKAYSCEYCDYQCVHKMYLSYHMKKKHGLVLSKQKMMTNLNKKMINSQN